MIEEKILPGFNSGVRNALLRVMDMLDDSNYSKQYMRSLIKLFLSNNITLHYFAMDILPDNIEVKTAHRKDKNGKPTLKIDRSFFYDKNTGEEVSPDKLPALF